MYQLRINGNRVHAPISLEYATRLLNRPPTVRELTATLHKVTDGYPIMRWEYNSDNYRHEWSMINSPFVRRIDWIVFLKEYQLWGNVEIARYLNISRQAVSAALRRYKRELNKF